MEENSKTEPLVSNTSSPMTYAKVLKKNYSSQSQTSSETPEDFSNNNPNSGLETASENEAFSVSTLNSSSVKDSLVSEDNKNNISSSITPDSLSENFEDAEDEYSNLNSISAADSIMTNGTVNKDETPSSLITECSSENKPTDLDIQTSSSAEESDNEESDFLYEDEKSGMEDRLYPDAMKWRFRSEKQIADLPGTVTVLETKYGSKVFVVGTAHFSSESQEDVAKTIKAVQPDIVVIELCKSRVNILALNEAAILEEAKSLNLQKMRQTVAENGFLQGVLHLLLLSMSAHLTKELGMAPGGEFRRAFVESKQIPGCIVHLGDRPIHVTLQRALAKLSLWQKLKVGWHMLRSKNSISKEEVERCKQRDLLEEMLAEMTGEFPELSQVFVKERDIYLTHSLQLAASPIFVAQNSDEKIVPHVVGVVGIGHVPGIQQHWGKVTEEDIPPLLCIPEPSRSSKFFRYAARYSLYGLGLYGLYKIFPRSLLSTKLFSALKQPFEK